MKKLLASARFNFVRLFQWHRMLGISALGLVAWFLVFHVFANADMSGFLPRNYAQRFYWPELPKFFTGEQTVGKSTVTVYTVPTQKITREQLAELPPDKPKR